MQLFDALTLDVRRGRRRRLRLRRPGTSSRIGRINLKVISFRACESVDEEGRFETQPARAAALGGEAETSRGLTPKRITTRNAFNWDNSHH